MKTMPENVKSLPTLPEAQLSIHKHLTEVLLSVIFDDGDNTMSQDDMRDAQDLTSLIIEALNLKVVTISPDDNLLCSVKLTAVK